MKNFICYLFFLCFFVVCLKLEFCKGVEFYESIYFIWFDVFFYGVDFLFIDEEFIIVVGVEVLFGFVNVRFMVLSVN